MTVAEIADLVDGSVRGDPDTEIDGAAPIDEAGPTELSFVATARYLRYLPDARAGALLLPTELAGEVAVERTAVVVSDVHRALATILPHLYPQQEPAPGVHPTAIVSDAARIGTAVRIDAYAVIGDDTAIGDGVRIGAHTVVEAGSSIGADSVLHSHVAVYRGVEIGARTIVHSGVRLGVDGFGYVEHDSGRKKVPQVGGCVIGSDVEIGANSTVDRGSIGNTVIGEGVKIDNLVHIGHNVRIGAHSVVVAQVGIAGSSRIGSRVTLAGQAGITGHIEIGDGATIAGQAGVVGDVPDGATYSGYPARPHAKMLRAQAALMRLPKMKRRLRELERRLPQERPAKE